MIFTTLEQETSTFSYHFRQDGIHEFLFHAVTPVEVNQWIDTTQHMKPFVIEHQLHVRALYHMAHVWPTPYAIRNATETIRQLPKTIPTSTALLLDDSNILITLVQMFLRQMPVRAMQSRRIFFQEDSAIQWLEERRLQLEAQGYWDLPREEVQRR